jgi:hypothetical protein
VVADRNGGQHGEIHSFQLQAWSPLVDESVSNPFSAYAFLVIPDTFDVFELAHKAVTRLTNRFIEAKRGILSLKNGHQLRDLRKPTKQVVKPCDCDALHTKSGAKRSPQIRWRSRAQRSFSMLTFPSLSHQFPEHVIQSRIPQHFQFPACNQFRAILCNRTFRCEAKCNGDGLCFFRSHQWLEPGT